MLEILAAVAVVLPRTEYSDAVFIQTQLQRVREFRDESGAVTSELWVSPDGRVQGCEVIRYTGAKAVADHVCTLMKRRRLKAPKGFSGERIYAISKMTTGWASTSSGSTGLAQELVRLNEPDRTVQSAAPDAAIDGRVMLVLAIDESGRAKTCKSLDEKHSERLTAYCQYVGDEQFAALKGEHGQAVPYLRTFTIAFASEARQDS